MATKKIELIFDLDAKDVQFATDKTLTLVEQIRILKKEIQKTQEGTKEFEILTNKLNETKDNFERVNVKSRELFGTLQLIPGPIGDIASKIDGAVSLLKTFSGFSLKDIQNQFKGFGNDIKEIVFNLGGIKTSQDAATKSGQELTRATQEQTSEFADNVKQQVGLESANARVAEGLEKSKAGVDSNTTATKALTNAQRAGTIAAGLFRAALAALGIGAVIALVGFLIDRISTLVGSLFAADDANQKLTESFDMLKRSIDATQQAIGDETKLLKTRAETIGATTDQIVEIERKGLQKRVDANKKASQQITQQALDLQKNVKISDEERVKKSAELDALQIENGKKLGDLLAEQRQFEADDEKRKADERRKRGDKAISDAKEIANKNKQIREQEQDELDKGLKEAFLSQLSAREKEEYAVNEKYSALQSLAVKYKQDTTELENARLKELADIRDKYGKEERDDRAAELDALIELEKQRGQDGLDTREAQLKEFLLKRMNIELEELDGVENAEARRLAIRLKYANLLKEELDKDEQDRRKNRIDALELELQDETLTLEQKFAIVKRLEGEIRSNTELNELEQFNLIKGYRDQLLQDLDSGYQAEIRMSENKYGLFARFTKEYYDEQRAAQAQYQADLDASLKAGTITQEQYNQRNAELGDARIKLNQLESESQLEKAGLIGDALGNLSKIVGEDTKAGKAFGIAKATVDTYQSAVAAYKALSGIPVIGPALGAIAAAAAVASGIATVKKIVAVQIPEAENVATTTLPKGTINVNAQKKAQGGMITGPGGPTSDSIPAFLSNGEFVVNARSTRLFQPLLAAINEYGINTPAFAAGGLAVQQANAPTMDNTTRIAEAIQQGISNQPIRTYVTSADITNQQQFDRVIKSRSLI